MSPVPLPSAAKALQPRLVVWRRHLHAHPELSYQEHETGAWLRERVRELGLEPRDIPNQAGFWVDLGPQDAPGRVALRADFDALPIQEETGHSFASTRPGVAHLCGHDLHATMLLGAATLLTERAERLAAPVRLLFQHAEEEVPGGAVDFMAAGALEGVERCFGLHVSSEVAVGRFAIRAGGMYAGSTKFRIRVVGRGCHAARPQEGADPIVAASAIVLALQSLISRRRDPFVPEVLTVGTVHGGDAYNAVPNTVELTGTARALSMKGLQALTDELEALSRATAAAYRCQLEFSSEVGNPPLENHPQAVAELSRSAAGVLGADAVDEARPRMGGEDFAYYTQACPCAFGMIGARRSSPDGTVYPLHHPRFDPDEEVLWRGAAVLASVVQLKGSGVGMG